MEKMPPKVTKTRRMYAAGGETGNKLKMVKDPDTGKRVPFFTVDENGVQKKGGGSVPPPKGYFKGGKTLLGSSLDSSGRAPSGSTLPGVGGDPSNPELMPESYYKAHPGLRPPSPGKVRPRGAGPRGGRGRR